MTEDELRAVEQHEPPFDNCWIDESTTTVSVTIGPTTFTMRETTAGEEARMVRESSVIQAAQSEPTDQQYALYARHLGAEPENLTDEQRADVKRLVNQDMHGVDGHRLMILRVAAAVGAYKRIAQEGWSDPRPVTIAAVEAMREGVKEILYLKYRDSFRV